MTMKSCGLFVRRMQSCFGPREEDGNTLDQFEEFRCLQGEGILEEAMDLARAQDSCNAQQLKQYRPVDANSLCTSHLR